MCSMQERERQFTFLLFFVLSCRPHRPEKLRRSSLVSIPLHLSFDPLAYF